MDFQLSGPNRPYFCWEIAYTQEKQTLSKEPTTLPNKNSLGRRSDKWHSYLTRHINSGVMVMPPNSAEYYFPPKYPVPANYWAVEQLYLSINLQMHDAPLKELDRRFNWCWCHKRFAEDMQHAFIIHLAGMPDRLPLLRDLRQGQGIAASVNRLFAGERA